ncbi:MAG: hypothetical protein ACRDH2_12080 [Anaerolineales bacterium]
MTTTSPLYPPGPRGGLRPGQLLALRRDPAGYLLNLARHTATSSTLRPGRSTYICSTTPTTWKKCW